MKKIVSIFFALLFANAAMAASLEDDVKQYVAIFSTESAVQPEVLESFAWMGISDPRVFDLIEQRVLRGADQAPKNKTKKNEIALSMRALGFSGQSKYANTLNKYVSDRTYARYAKTALKEMPDYQKWNAVISNRATFDPRYSDDANRILNMLHSDDFMLKRIGAKRVYFSNKDDVLLETLVSEIRATYGKTNIDSETSDAIAWMVKALASTGQERYQPFFQEVLEKSSDQKVKRYAERAFDR
ncbi:hypothetical protein [Oxalicibacterium solurbis]|uniref:Uncharacterized protein n=1 Tax=Oxalicibacterium solurbis TaxID=69280 RepID=A0A8J3B378_9BURK|nr:hypothetical protein [Oxalicibacterium solurbis]GGI54278.1 hypothetical protein GCM10011430_14520 [Oxalicibacterium solurbis]